MKNYQDLQKLYVLPEIKKQCVDIDFAYAFICAMASSELELQQWMPMLFVKDDDSFSDQQIATDFAQAVLAVYEQSIEYFQEDTPLPLMIEASVSTQNEAALNFANGYLQALMLIDNLQLMQFPDDSPVTNLQQTCLLLLDKLATVDTDDAQKLALFEQLPTHGEIITLLPVLLASYGHNCLLVKANG
ncbi:MAG: YecA family protein [Psychromonas sp.]|nr:YecA family protein [Alteromonadales bacterium]MCP5078427.1 YecA family protein [Psychromonas sp.]